MTTPLTHRVDPDWAADERTTLVQFLDWYRATIAQKIDGITDEQARETTVPPSDLNLLGLVRHLAEVERSWFRRSFVGEDAPPIYYGAAHPTSDEDGDLHPGPLDTVADALAVWSAEVQRSRQVVDDCPSLDQLSAGPTSGGGLPNLRFILVHLIEEYARHCGHADLLRERIDGVTGD